MFSSLSKLQFKDGALRAIIDDDFSKYYRKLYYYDSYSLHRMLRPKHGTHISIVYPKRHGIIKDAEKYHGRIITFYYNPEEIYQGGFTKGFIGFYLPVYSQDIEDIKKELGIIEEDSDGKHYSLHVSLFQNKHFSNLTK